MVEWVKNHRDKTNEVVEIRGLFGRLRLKNFIKMKAYCFISATT